MLAMLWWPTFLSSLGSHLWQTTLFAGVVATLILAMGKNSARVRHGMWFARRLGACEPRRERLRGSPVPDARRTRGPSADEPRRTRLLKGHFEISLDVIPLFLTVQDNVAYGFHAGLLFRHYMRPDATMRPFVSFGSGPLVSTEQVPVGTSRFNFASSLGAGVLFRKSERAAYMIEARVHHISNADTADTNPGINSIYFQFGISFFR